MIAGATETKSQKAAGGVWDYISPSRLNLWARCPLAFKLRYIDGVRSPTTPALFLGKTVHAALEFHYRHLQLGIPLPTDDVIAEIGETWEQAVSEDNVRFADLAAEDKLRCQAESLTRTYLDHVAGNDPPPTLVEAKVECPLIDPMNGEDLGIPLLGIIDLVQDSGSGETICDFKTASSSSVPHEVTHEVQLTAYAYAFRQLSGREEAGLQIRSIIKTKTPKIAFHSYATRTDANFCRFFALVRAYLDDLDNSKFVYRPSFGCGMCDFREKGCKSWTG